MHSIPETQYKYRQANRYTDRELLSFQFIRDCVENFRFCMHKYDRNGDEKFLKFLLLFQYFRNAFRVFIIKFFTIVLNQKCLVLEFYGKKNLRELINLKFEMNS